MSDQPGTLEALANVISGSLAPLDGLNISSAEAVTHELGLTFDPALISDISFTNSLQVLAQSAAMLSPLMDQLIKAVSTDGIAEIIVKGVALIAAISGVIDGVDGINNKISGFASALSDYLIIRYLEKVLPATTNVLTFFGLIDRQQLPDSPVRRRLHLNRLSLFLTNPSQLLKDVLGWGVSDFNGNVLFARLYDALYNIAYPIALDNLNGAPVLETYFFDLSLLQASDPLPAGVSINLNLPLDGNIGKVFPLGNGWSAHLSGSVMLLAGTKILIRPLVQIEAVPETPSNSTKIEGSLLTEIVGSPVPPMDSLVLFAIGKSRLQAKSFRAGMGLSFKWDALTDRALAEPNVAVTLEGGKLHIDTSTGDGFIQKLTSGLKLDADFQFGLLWSPSHGVQFQGGGGMAIQLPVHLSIGPLDIPSIYLRADIKTNTCPIEISASLKANLGPLLIVIDRLGALANLSFPSTRQGNLGLLDLQVGFKPPSSVGITVDAGIVKGGGFLNFDPDREEYDGMLELSIAEIVSVKAIGLITTKMPDGSKGFSLLLILTSEFGSGIQLGFGFTLIGVGGLLGLNRTVNIQPLVEGVRTGAVSSIMFPQNPIANAPRIISDLKLIFPPLVGKFLLGPMAKLGWGTPNLVSVTLGLIIEIPGGDPTILGILKIALPTEAAPLIVLQINFLGRIEFDKKRLYFVAVLFDSRVLFMTIEGGMGLLIAWGQDANFIVSVGGFHPGFSPPPMPFPVPTRVTVNILNNSYCRIRCEGYFAVTSNTAQFGAKAEMMIDVDIAQVEGHLSFDAMFQFSPFYFIIGISAGLSLKVFGMGLFSVSLQFSLAGPSPWRARGKGYVSLLFFDVSADFDITWGDSKDTTLPPIEVMPLLSDELKKTQNWKAELPLGNNLLVTLRELSDDENSLVLHPLGTLRISQRVVPLNVKIDKVGNQKPSDASKFSIEASGALSRTGDAQEQFAKAQFFTMSDSDKLSQRAFDPYAGGVLLGAGSQTLGSTKLARRRVRYEKIVLDNNQRTHKRFAVFNANFFNHFMAGSAISKSSLSKQYQLQRNPFEEKISVREGGYKVAYIENNRPYQSMSFSSETLAKQYIQEQVSQNPMLHETLHVIAGYEVNTEAWVA